MALDVEDSKYKDTKRTDISSVTYVVITIAVLVILGLSILILPTTVVCEPMKGYITKSGILSDIQSEHKSKPNKKSVTWAADLVSIKLIPGRKTPSYQEEQVTK
jgi:hypothetical protein